MTLVRMDYTVVGIAETGKRAVVQADKERPDLVLIDICLKGKMDGIEAAERIRTQFDIPVVFLMTSADMKRLDRAKLTIPFGYLLKPFMDKDLIMAVKMGLYTAGLDAKRNETETQLKEEHNELEARVRERTAELTEANRKLMDEIALRTQVQAHLKAQEEKLLEAHQIARLGHFEHDLLRDIIEWSDELYRIFGVSPQHFTPTKDSLMEMIHPEDREAVKNYIEVSVREKRQNEHIHRIIVLSGETRYVHTRSRMVRSDNGEPKKVLGTVQDITKYKKMEQTILDRELQMRSLLENIPDIVVRYDTGLNRIYANAQWEQFTSLTMAEFIGKSIEDTPKMPEPSFSRYLSCLKQVLRTGKIRKIELHWDRPTGESVDVEFLIVPEFNQDKTLVSLLSVGRDVTSHKDTERKLTQSREMLQAVFNGISDPLILVDGKMSVLVMNTAASSYYGVQMEEVLMRPCHKVVEKQNGQCHDCKIPELIRHNKAMTFERQGWIDPNRMERVSTYPVSGDGSDGRMIIRIRDITEEKTMQRSMAQADRLASLGLLSGGIAHEIRNPLGGIRLFLDILNDEARFERSDTERDLLNEINQNIDKIDEIIKRVLAFSQPDQGNAKPLEINGLIHETLPLFESKFKKLAIAKHLDFYEPLPAVNADKVGIQQVVVNIISNAIDAMSRNGTLTIETFASESIFFPNRCVTGMKIKDTGCGIDSGDKEKIFTPFFTTKPNGTGLGLAISYQIIQQHGGIISFESSAENGTEFTIELPSVSNHCHSDSDVVI